jgi:hypothetical protein
VTHKERRSRSTPLAHIAPTCCNRHAFGPPTSFRTHSALNSVLTFPPLLSAARVLICLCAVNSSESFSGFSFWCVEKQRGPTRHKCVQQGSAAIAPVLRTSLLRGLSVNIASKRYLRPSVYAAAHPECQHVLCQPGWGCAQHALHFIFALIMTICLVKYI